MDSPRSAPDLVAAEATFALLMRQLGLDVEGDPQLCGSQRRVVTLWGEILRGEQGGAPQVSRFDVGEGPGKGEPVIIRGLPFYSMCAHHFLPFFGEIDIAYLPGESIGGVGSFSRVIRHFAHRPQVQERLVAQVAEALDEALAPEGLYVRSRARHLCMEMRGEKVRGELVSTAATGALKEGPRRQEVLRLLERPA